MLPVVATVMRSGPAAAAASVAKPAAEPDATMATIRAASPANGLRTPPPFAGAVPHDLAVSR